MPVKGLQQAEGDGTPRTRAAVGQQGTTTLVFRVRSERQDAVAGSRFAWGELRPWPPAPG